MEPHGRHAACTRDIFGLCAAARGLLCRAVYFARHPDAVLPGLAQGQGSGSQDDRHRARRADGGAGPGHTGCDARRRPARRHTGRHGARLRGERCRLYARRFVGRRCCNFDRLYAHVARFDAGDAAFRDLCTQGSFGARPNLWAGAAVGLVCLYRREFRRRICGRCAAGARSHLADGGGDNSAGACRIDVAVASVAAARAGRAHHGRGRHCCAIRPSLRCWPPQA